MLNKYVHNIHYLRLLEKVPLTLEPIIFMFPMSSVFFPFLVFVCCLFTSWTLWTRTWLLRSSDSTFVAHLYDGTVFIERLFSHILIPFHHPSVFFFSCFSLYILYHLCFCHLYITCYMVYWRQQILNGFYYISNSISKIR